MSDAVSNLIILAQGTVGLPVQATPPATAGPPPTAVPSASPTPPATSGPAATVGPPPHETPAASGTEQAPEKGVFPPFDTTYFPSTLLWLAITFIALYFVISRLAIPRIGMILEARRGRIESDLRAAERMKAESEAAAAGYEKSLAEARSGAGRIAEEARGKARTAADAKRATIEASLAEKLAKAEAEIDQIKTRALAEVGTVARDAAGAIVKLLTGDDATSAEIAEAVNKAMVR